MAREIPESGNIFLICAELIRGIVNTLIVYENFDILPIFWYAKRQLEYPCV